MNELSLFRCLADPTRLLILQHLSAGGDQTVTQLVETTGQERTNVSHHLARLRACGLVHNRPEGKRVFYSLGHSRLKDLLAISSEVGLHIATADPQACVAEGCC